MPVNSERVVLLVAHTGRPAALHSARLVVDRLAAAGLTVRVLATEAPELQSPAAGPGGLVGRGRGRRGDGDGDRRRRHAAAGRRAGPAAGVPLLGVNLGHVGFLAEADPEDLAGTVDRVVAGRYAVERRMTIDVTVRTNGNVTATTWALNEATVEKAARERMLDVVTEVDGRPLSRWGCDGVVFATPTGSTAYAFSAGGPVVWPEVEALLLVPISAHALFAGPMVVSPRSVLAAEVIGGSAMRRQAAAGEGQSGASGAVLWCDGRRRVDLPPGARVEVRRGASPVLLARLDGTGQDGCGVRRAVHRPAGGQVRAAGDRLARPGRRASCDGGHRAARGGSGQRCLRKSVSAASE